MKECSICLENKTNKNFYTYPVCGHEFCFKCKQTFMETYKKNNKTYSLPIKTPLISEEIEIHKGNHRMHYCFICRCLKYYDERPIKIMLEFAHKYYYYITCLSDIDKLIGISEKFAEHMYERYDEFENKTLMFKIDYNENARIMTMIPLYDDTQREINKDYIYNETISHSEFFFTRYTNL